MQKAYATASHFKAKQDDAAKTPRLIRIVFTQAGSIAVIKRGCQAPTVPLSPVEFGRLIRECWSVDSASTYSLANSACGQCSVTALVAQDYLGGTIAKTRVGDAWHFYNRIDDERFDFTASQFESPIVYDDTLSGRDDALTDTTLRQYAALTKAFRKLR